MKYLVFILFLTACGNSTERVVTTSRNIYLPIQERPTEITTYPVEFLVQNGMICMSGKSYENLSKNVEEVKRFMIQQNNLIEYYEGGNHVEEPSQIGKK